MEMKARLNAKQIITYALLTLLFNVLIAILLSTVGGRFSINLVFSLCIGFSIALLSMLAVQSGLFVSLPMKILSAIAAIVLGALFGSYLAIQILGLDIELLPRHGNFGIFNPVILGLFFGSAVTLFFYAMNRIYRLDSLAKEEQIQRLAREQELAQAQIKLIQAQIEPHFLFNTLANISSLIERDSAKAKQMLEDLNRYLRTVLARTREGDTTLGEELELLQAYLSIIAVRMGGRLHYQLDIPESLQTLAFPPLLIQPLVENAIKHGLEPKLEGGSIEVRARRNDNHLCIEVKDSGVGLNGAWQSGVGLNNVYQRLQGLYGRQTEFAVNNNEAGGVTVRFCLPLEAEPGEKA